MQAILKRYQGEEIPQLAGSDGSIVHFKLRNGFSSRLTHLKRCPAVETRIDPAGLMLWLVY
jgi:hypothetical protein